MSRGAHRRPGLVGRALNGGSKHGTESLPEAKVVTDERPFANLQPNPLADYDPALSAAFLDSFEGCSDEQIGAAIEDQLIQAVTVNNAQATTDGQRTFAAEVGGILAEALVVEPETETNDTQLPQEYSAGDAATHNGYAPAPPPWVAAPEQLPGQFDGGQQ